MSAAVNPSPIVDYTTFTSQIYTPLEEAVAILRERQTLNLFPELDSDSSIDIPAVLRNRPVALTGRQLSTPNHEMSRFLDLSATHGLYPVCWEYHKDKFVARNAVKHSRGRLGLFQGIGRNGGLKVEFVNVIDFTAAEGLTLREVRTLWGQSWVDFHHQLLIAEFPQLSGENLYDASAWFARHGGNARNYYSAFMTLFLRHAIWFEWFLLNDEEGPFTTEVIWPAFQDVYKRYGVKPLIVPLDDAPGCVCEETYWKYYPLSVGARTKAIASAFEATSDSTLAKTKRYSTSAQTSLSSARAESSAERAPRHRALAERVYTPLEDAIAELDRRQAGRMLPELDHPGFLDIPAHLHAPRMAVMFRQIGTPNHELQRAIVLAQRVGLDLVVWEYHADRFLTRNSCKHALGRMRFHNGIGRNGGRKTQTVNIIDFNSQDGKPMDAVITTWGESLIDFHHELLHLQFGCNGVPELFDASSWFARHGGRARHYYRAFTMLFLRHAILFETFMMEGSEFQFTQQVFLPAFNDLVSAFGTKPLVVRIEDIETEGDDYWLSYPGALHAIVSEKQKAAKTKQAS